MTLDDSLAELVDKGLIGFDIAYPYFEDSEKRATVQKRHYRVTPIREGALGPRELEDRR